jgi:hypothetical protein
LYRTTKRARMEVMLATRLPSVSETPPFAFLVQGFPTGGGGGGNGEPDLVLPALALSVLSETVNEAYGRNFANGFANGSGFGVGSGVPSTTEVNRLVAGQGGGTAFGQGNILFEVDEAFGATFANSGLRRWRCLRRFQPSCCPDLWCFYHPSSDGSLIS